MSGPEQLRRQRELEDYRESIQPPVKVPKGNYLNPLNWLRGIVQATIRARPVRKIWEWIDAGNVSIPLIVGSPNPGPLKTDRFPIYRGLYDLIQQPHVHFFSFCSSVRTGKTLLSICVVLWWIVERCGGPILWLDPTRKSAIKFSNTELDPFIRECPGAWAKAILGKTTWTTLEKFFRGIFLRLVGSGAEADLHGFQAELVILNESDRLRASIDKDATSADKAIARSAQFEHTRLVIRNSTPEEELGDIWQHFLQGTQHHAYVPCPHCSKADKNAGREWRRPDVAGLGRSMESYEPWLKGWQRLTFSSVSADVPFNDDGSPLLPRQVRTEKTGRIKFEQFAIYDRREIQPGKFENVKVGYDIPAVQQGATYECAHCGKDIERADLGWMLDRYWWRAHNPSAPPDHISAHLWSAYSPFQSWGAIAKEFLQSKGNAAALRKFLNLTCGLPFVRYATTIKEDDLDRAIRRCPVPYLKGQLPLKPEILTMTVDVGGMVSGNFWWSIRAWGVLWDHPERPTWSALVDWGPAVSWQMIEEIAGLRPLPAGGEGEGRYNEYLWRDPKTGEVHRFRVTAGLVDSGYEAKQDKNVYEFCLRHDAVFSPSKGGGQQHLRGGYIRPSPQNFDGHEFELVWYWDDWFKQSLYCHCIKEGRYLWFVPTNLDDDYRGHLTAERTEERNGKLEWIRDGDNHLADTEKEHEVMRDGVEETLDEIRDHVRAVEDAAAAAPAA